MEEDVQLRTYTVANLKDWLLHNTPAEGLTPAVIEQTRAYSIIHNPFVKDTDQVVCAMFVNGKLSAYTAAFPEILQKPKDRLAWWFTTLWCDPNYSGRGYGLIVIGTLCELIGEDNFFDAEGAPETVEIFKILGLKTVFVPRYYLLGRNITNGGFKRIVASIVEKERLLGCSMRKRRQIKRLTNIAYSLIYNDYLDDEAYSFIVSHCNNDIVLRKKEAFNWILRYPFAISSPLIHRVENKNHFSSYVIDYASYFLKVFSNDCLIGVSMIVQSEGMFSVKYLYYSTDSSAIVYDAILEHLLNTGAKSFSTNDCCLADYIWKTRIYTKYRTSSCSFSAPTTFFTSDSCLLQAGEGDMFL